MRLRPGTTFAMAWEIGDSGQRPRRSMATADVAVRLHATISPLERLLSRQGSSGHEMRRSATTTKLFPKAKPRVDVGANGDRARRKGRKRMRRVRSNVLRPLAQKYAPSRDIKHLVTAGHPLSPTASKHSRMSSTRSNSAVVAHPPRQEVPSATNSQVILLIDTNVSFHRKRSRAYKAGCRKWSSPTLHIS